MAEVVGGGPPVNDGERAVIAFLRDHAPDDWLVMHNVEVPVRNELFEVDLVVVAPHAVYVIDVKGTRGRIEVAGSRWCPSRRAPFASPVKKIRGNARAIKGQLERIRRELHDIYVSPLVVLTARNAHLIDPAERDSGDVAAFDDLLTVLNDTSRLPDWSARDLRPYRQAIREALLGAVRPAATTPRFGTWEVVERLGGDQFVSEYRARNAAAPSGAATALLRVYHVDPFVSDQERTAERLRIGNAYEALSKLPPHPNIVGARTFDALDDEERFVLVLDDVHGHALTLHFTRPQLALSADAKLRVIQDALRGLTHAHAFRVAHRALSPTNVLIASDGRALLTGFDYARTAAPRDHTVVDQLGELEDAEYLAPECHNHPEKRGAASDVYALGVTAYRLLTGELPFANATEQDELRSVLPQEPLVSAAVPLDLISLLRRMCAYDPADRPAPRSALRQLRRTMGGRVGPRSTEETPSADTADPNFYRELPADYRLTRKYAVRRRLGRPGTFGVAYQVYDMLARTDRALKLVLKDRESVIERLQHEYQILLDLEPHPNVVRVLDADFLPNADIPFLVLEYVDGHDIATLISSERLPSPADVVQLGIDAASGLAHLHRNGVYHCDIKPSNLLWTETGCKIIDFNVAVTADSTLTHGGGSARYLPPDLNRQGHPTADELADRDAYALGVTLYEVLTGDYPWDASVPPPGQAPRDPRATGRANDLTTLSAQFVDTLCKAIAPRRSERYRGAAEFVAALETITVFHTPRVETRPELERKASTGEIPPNTNVFVNYLQTLYSQSRRSNQGTRGRDPADAQIYICTALDTVLCDEVLAGQHRLVVITGNAGDGKTAFLEELMNRARDRDQDVHLGSWRGNGADFTFEGRPIHINLDGSQDEDDKANDDVLAEFFGRFAGSDESTWPTNGTWLIAINEGRLVDFLTAHKEQFPQLTEASLAGLTEGDSRTDGVTVVNLNHRSVVAGLDEVQPSIFDALLKRIVDRQFWDACQSCDLVKVCYAPHNALTLSHPTIGPRVIERLRTLYSLAHLRGRLHITLRDLRSALAFTLTSGRDCAQIHELYEQRDFRRQEILDSFYFSSWIGPEDGKDRLLAQLREVDVAATPDAQLDRKLDYVGPADSKALMTVDGRGDYDLQLLRQLFAHLPRSAEASATQAGAHREYLKATRRRFFFECSDEERWRALLPFRSAQRFLDLLHHPERVPEQLPDLIAAINRGEGLVNPTALGDALALQVRLVPGGTIRSYRLFPADALEAAAIGPSASPYLETGLDSIALRYHGPGGQQAQLLIQLDLYELLQRLRDGYLPGVADLQGVHLSLTIFKNVLSSVPYQEVLLTTTGRDLHRIRREADGRLVMSQTGDANGMDMEAGA